MPLETEELLQSAIQLRTARAVQDHINNLENVTRLQTDERLQEILGARDEIMKSQERIADQQVALMTSLMSLLERIEQVVKRKPPDMKANVRLEQQPVTVNVPQQSIAMSPKINVPDPKVVVQQADAPRKATIKHSDGTQSTVEFI